MKIGVTGGSGFIGSRIVNQLAKLGHDVLSIDIVEPAQRNNFSFAKADLTSFDETQKLVEGLDLVYHVAGTVLDQVRADPYRASEININITRNVAEASRKNNVKKIIFASSFYVYDGLPPQMIVNEATPLNTLDMELFGGTKVFGETLLKEYARKYGIKYVILRFGSAYGPGGQGSNVIKTFLDAAIAGQTIEIWGPGRRKNQYTFVEDLAKGSVSALTKDNEIYNLISPEETTVKQLTEIVSQKVVAKVHFALDKKEGSSMPYMSSRKAINELNWQPITVDKGIDRILGRSTEEWLTTTN